MAPPTGENDFLQWESLIPPRGRLLYPPKGSAPPHGGNHHTPPRGVVQKHSPIKASRYEKPSYSPPGESFPLGGDHHTPHRGSRSPLGEIIIFTFHRGMESLPTGGDYHTPHMGGILSPPRESFLTGGDHRTPPRGVFPPRGRPFNPPKGSQKQE
jgi:hypothetical protein